MIREEKRELLIDYAEGTIDDSRKITVESELQRSPELRIELQLIKETLFRLDEIEEIGVPTHYFPNFLPRLREKLQKEKWTIELLLPAWLRAIAIPLVSLIIISGVIGMYVLLQPPNYNSNLYSAIQAAEQESGEEGFKINFPEYSSGTISWDVESIIQSEEIQSNVDVNTIAFEFIKENSLFDNLTNDNQILSQLSDDEIEWIADNLNNNGVN